MEMAVAIIGLIAGFLAYHDDYEDGVIGRASFAVIVLMAVIIVFGRLFGHYRYDMPLEVTALLWALAAFMGRHAWRFLKFRCFECPNVTTWDGVDRRLH